MCKKINGYFTIEASCIIPIVLLLHFLIIFSSIYLYDQCVMTQDNYYLCLRGMRYTRAEQNYAEVIYGEADLNTWNSENYILSRIKKRNQTYPCFEAKEIVYIKTHNSISIMTSNKTFPLKIIKEMSGINPVEMIRNRRKNAGD